MRYKRINTLALDVSAVPPSHRLATVQPFLAFLNLDPTKLKSVQVHSSRKVIYIGMPDDMSAAAIASKTPRFTINVDGTKHYVPLLFVDEDIIDVRVRDLPPETPNDVIEQVLRMYGTVQAVTSEVWRDFFPGVLTGVRIARMKVSKNIPSYVAIGSSQAFITYPGQSETCSSCLESGHRKSECQKIGDPQQKKFPRLTSNESSKVEQQQQQKTATKKTSPPAGNAASTKPLATSNEAMDLDDAASSGFMKVTRKRGKATHPQQPLQQQQQLSHPIHPPASSIPLLSEGEVRIRDKMIDVLQAIGVPISDEEVEKIKKGGILGK